MEQIIIDINVKYSDKWKIIIEEFDRCKCLKLIENEYICDINEI